MKSLTSAIALTLLAVSALTGTAYANSHKEAPAIAASAAMPAMAAKPAAADAPAAAAAPAAAPAKAPAASSCKAQASDKKLAGAAKKSFMKKCKADAARPAA